MITELFVRGPDGHYTPEVNPEAAWVIEYPGDAQTLDGEPVEMLPTDFESLRGLLAPDGALHQEPGICWIHDDEHKAVVLAADF